MYVIKRTDQGGGYLAKKGSRKSYVFNMYNARIFATREDAEAERCENEIVKEIEELRPCR